MIKHEKNDRSLRALNCPDVVSKTGLYLRGGAPAVTRDRQQSFPERFIQAEKFLRAETVETRRLKRFLQKHRHCKYAARLCFWRERGSVASGKSFPPVFQAMGRAHSGSALTAPLCARLAGGCNPIAFGRAGGWGRSQVHSLPRPAPPAILFARRHSQGGRR